MKIVNIILTVVILVLGYLLFRSIKTPIEYQKEKIFRYGKVVERLKEIRDAQLAYKSEHGNYSASFDTLVAFVKSGRFTLIRQIGNPEDSGAVIIRDTLFVNVRDSLFAGRMNFIDSLPFVPFGGGARFDMQAGEIEKGKVMVDVFQVKDTKPFDPNDVLQVGSMTEPTNAGNWE